jgi:hypothetical protein
MRTWWAVTGIVTTVVLLGCSHASGSVSPGPAAASEAPSAIGARAVPSANALPATPDPTATSLPTPKPTPVPLPPKPSGVALLFSDNAVDADATPSEVTMTVTWKAPRTKGLTIKVFGVNRCLRTHDDEPCLVVNTRLPAGSLEYITEAPARDGKLSWTWPGWDPNSTRLALMTAPSGSEIYSVVLAAYGPPGHSKFAIAVTVE